jgi:hypothetical protein
MPDAARAFTGDQVRQTCCKLIITSSPKIEFANKAQCPSDRPQAFDFRLKDARAAAMPFKKGSLRAGQMCLKMLSTKPIKNLLTIEAERGRYDAMQTEHPGRGFTLVADVSGVV